MSQSTFTLLNDMFVQPPGDFLFFLVVMILNLISLLMSLSFSTDEQKAQQRYTLALFGVVFAWSLMFAGVLFIRFTDQSSTAILPPLERAVTAASLLLPGWAFLTADHARWRKSSNTILLLLLLVVVIAYAITGILWIEISDVMDFNLGGFGLAWTFALFAMPVLGIVLTIFLFRDVVDAPLKLVYFSLIAFGGGLTLYQMTQFGPIGNYTGIYRMTFTLAQVLVPLLVYRVVIDRYEQILEDRSIRGSTPIPPPIISTATSSAPEPVRISHTDALNAQLLKAMGMMLESGDPEGIPTRIVSTLLDILRADIGALLRLQDINYADVSVAQDRMMGREIAGLSLNMDNQPTLVNAIERRSQRGLYPDRNVEELDDLYERMYIDQRGPIYFQPLTHHGEVFAILLVGMPYTRRELRAEEVELLKGIGSVAGSLLAVSYNAIEATKNAEDRMIQAMIEGIDPSIGQDTDDETMQSRIALQNKLDTARDEIQSLVKQVSELNHQLIHEHNRIASMLGDSIEDLSISQRITAITDEQIRLREEREQLTVRLKETETALQSVSASDSDNPMNHLIESLRKEKEILEVEKIRLKEQLDEIRSQGESAPADLQRLINRMMKEKQDLKTERDQLGDKLENLSQELQALGIEDDVTGLSEWISRLSEERQILKNQNDVLQKERNALLKERETVRLKIDQEKDRDTQIESLQGKIEKLASDREVAIKQRDKLRAEYNKIVGALNMVKEHRARLVAESSGFELEMDESREEQAKLRAQVQELADNRSHLMHERDKLVAENTALVTELEQTLSRMDGDSGRMKQINEEGVGSLKGMIEELSQQRDTLERELNQAQTRLSELEKQLKTDTSEQTATTITYEPKEPELLVGLVQELRTPMTSIAGYIDLLLSESAGILGEMQRKFLQRVGANITRLDSMIDSLVHVTQLDTGNYALEPQPVDLIHLVENAITNSSMQFREKGLAVTLDLDEGMPRLPADEDAMKQIIGQLLTNAYLVSPPNSDINVTVVRRSLSLLDDADPRNCAYLAVRDSGGGISSEDIPRVFARKYKADNPLIQGLGDTGVGMSIARALVEAHEGKLWVESNDGTGSVFAFAIPLDLESVKKRD